MRILSIKIMQNLALGRRGREELIDIGVVDLLLRMMKEGEGMDAYCLALMHTIYMHCLLKFKELVMAANVESVLEEEKEEWGEERKVMVNEMLAMMQQGEDSDQEPSSEPAAKSSSTWRSCEKKLLSPLLVEVEKWKMEDEMMQKGESSQ